VVDLETDVGQRDHFQRAEACAQGDDRRRRADEVQMVQGAQHAASHEHDRGEQHRNRRDRRLDQAEPGEDQGHDGGGEHFEEALDPQVHQPPAPVLDFRDMSVFVPHQGGAIEQADRDGGQEQKCDDRTRGGRWSAQHWP
jgi:hypothetical protein